MADFEAVVLDGKTPEAPAEASLGELRPALAIYRSATSRRWEKRGSEGDRNRVGSSPDLQSSDSVVPGNRDARVSGSRECLWPLQ